MLSLFGGLAAAGAGGLGIAQAAAPAPAIPGPEALPPELKAGLDQADAAFSQTVVRERVVVRRRPRRPVVVRRRTVIVRRPRPRRVVVRRRVIYR
jgi:hypothetical protein